jgi:cytochrome c
MMTGVFHFRAISLGLRLTTGNVRLRPPAINVWLLAVCVFLGTSTGLGIAAETRFGVLVFSKTTGFRHDSIPQGIAAIEAVAAEHGFGVESTEDAAQFTEAALARYRVIVFLSTTGDILDAEQKAAFERYIRAGGGFVGVHSASDTEYQWPWYGGLVGAYFASHPAIQRGTVRISDASHPSTKGLPEIWVRTDEWYNFRSNPRGVVHVLASLDESTYSGGAMGADHPIAWCQEIDGGRSWYTAMGHTTESYAEPLFRLHLLGGIESVAGAAGSCAVGAERSR